MDIQIESKNIGPGFPPFIIAEMSGNHNQSLERSLQIVEAAAKAGAHAIKLQTYSADTMTLDINKNEFTISDPKSLWNGKSLYELYQEAHTPWEWHKNIFDRAKELGIIAFSTPFDATAVDFLEDLNVPVYKIASFENIDIPLIKKIAQTGKPIIMSTGMASLSELDESVKTIRANGCEQIILLKCTSAYPADPKDINLKTISHLQKHFDVQVGLSDHTLGIGVSLASVALGATVIEKHFTLSRAEGGVDSAFSLEPDELGRLVQDSKFAWQALGKVNYELTEKEKKSRQFRRSLYITEDMRAGDRITDKNMRAIRPGLGLAPKEYDKLLGKKVTCDIRRGTAVSWSIIEE
ncbi:MAG: pseudaminic acid synthase [candidate division Zixibacteria bacterium]|nr:pseudaminic acid synthase [candidate division Zixibacteria bacterium]